MTNRSPSSNTYMSSIIGNALGRVNFITAPLLAAVAGLLVGDLTVVSALNAGASTRYRVIAVLRPTPQAAAVEPSLEDGYVALMQKRTTAATLPQPA